MLDLFSKNLQDDSVEILVRVDSVEIFCSSLILQHDFLKVLQAPSKVQSACLWFCSMKFYKFYKPHPKSQSACIWFCSMNALTSYKSHPKSQMPVFDFVARVCLQVSQVSPRCPKWPVFGFVAWVPLHDFTSQLKVSKMTGFWFCSMFSLNRNPKLVAQFSVTRFLIL